jgi:hypothetical protein
VPGQRASGVTQGAFRQEADVVEQVFLEVRVVGGDAGDAACAGQAQAGVVRGKRRLHMYHMKVGAGETAIKVGERGPAHQAVLGIEGHGARGQADGIRHGFGGAVRLSVIGRHHGDPHAEIRQRAAKGQDRGGDAVDAREIDIAQHQHMQRPESVPGEDAAPVAQAEFLRQRRNAHAATGSAGFMK